MGGLELIFPEPELTAEQKQLYRLYTILEPKAGNFTEGFFMEVTLFNDTIIVDKFSMAGVTNATEARGNGNLLWSIVAIDGLVIEIESTTPVDFGFTWFDDIVSSEASELPPSARNMYEWTFDYSLYFIRIQLGPRFNQTGG
jgi:hypothetical protein